MKEEAPDVHPGFRHVVSNEAPEAHPGFRRVISNEAPDAYPGFRRVVSNEAPDVHPGFRRTAIAAIVLMIVVGGCQTAKVAQPLTGKLAGNDPDSQLEFWHTLAMRPVTSNDEAFHGLLLYADGQDPANDYGGRIRVLKSRKMLPAKFDAPADQAVERGPLAVAICRLLEIKGGVMLRLTGAQRYAVRELQFLDLYPPSWPHQTFSGSEYLGIVGRLEDYQRGNPADAPASVMPGEIRPGAATQPAGRR